MDSDDYLDSAARGGVPGGRLSVVEAARARWTTLGPELFTVLWALLVLAFVAFVGSAFATWLGAALVMATAWGFVEMIPRDGRAGFRATVLTAAFVGGAFATAIIVLDATDGWGGWSSIAPGSAAVLAATLHWCRFRVPVAIGLGVFMFIPTVVELAQLVMPTDRIYDGELMFIGGMVAIAVALRLDASDRTRQALRSRYAASIYAFAAPFLVIPVCLWLGDANGQATTPTQAAAVFLGYALMAALALLVDRWGPLVAGLLPLLIWWAPLNWHEHHGDPGIAAAALGIGITQVLLVFFWRPCRAAVLRWLPTGLTRQLAPVR